MPRSPKPDPYCAFKDDHARLAALRSRDRRLVLIALFSGSFSLIGLIVRWAWHVGM